MNKKSNKETQRCNGLGSRGGSDALPGGADQVRCPRYQNNMDGCKVDKILRKNRITHNCPKFYKGRIKMNVKRLETLNLINVDETINKVKNMSKLSFLLLKKLKSENTNGFGWDRSVQVQFGTGVEGV